MRACDSRPPRHPEARLLRSGPLSAGWYALVILHLLAALEFSAQAGELREAAPADYDYALTDGLYATLTSMEGLPKPEVKGEKKLKFKKVEGFKSEIQVRLALQPGPAPLAVIFLGLASRSKDPLARLWLAQLSEAGCHVLVFDSVFRPSFNERSRHGAAGNLKAEAQAACNLVTAALKHPELEGKVTKVGLLGASYGGILALNFAKLAREGKVPLRPERVLVFSPPVSVRSSAAVLDGFYDRDRAAFDLWTLSKLNGHKPVAAGQALPFPAALMRAGIGYTFRKDLEDAIESTEELYQYRLEPEAVGIGSGSGGRVVERAFVRFIEEAVFPYWKKRGAVQNLEELWSWGELGPLLKKGAEGVHVILARDDPLNAPNAAVALQAECGTDLVTVLPHGGHLGYLSSRWAKARVQMLFE